VAEVAALLPALVTLEFEGRYAAMLSHEPKNYALLGYDGKLTLRGVAFRSSRLEPFGEAFLRRAVRALLERDVAGVRAAYVDTVMALRARTYTTHDVATHVRLTKTPEQYEATRHARRELPYEAMLAAGRAHWRRGERVRVYRTQEGGAGLVRERAAQAADYDVAHYLRVLLRNHAARLQRAFAPQDHAALFADPTQGELFPARFEVMQPVLRVIE
jgi:DNA polymerase elongation subunit (family B)